ncbi:hypothetical protein AB2063_002561 [Clostridium botulinum]
MKIYNNLSSFNRILEQAERFNNINTGIQNMISNMDMVTRAQLPIQRMLNNCNGLIAQTMVLPKFYDSLVFKNIDYVCNSSFYQSYYKIFDSMQPLLKIGELANKLQNNIFIRNLDLLYLGGNSISVDMEDVNLNEISELVEDNEVLDSEYIEKEDSELLSEIISNFNEKVISQNYDMADGIKYLVDLVHELNEKIEKLEDKVDKDTVSIKNTIIGFLMCFLFWILPPSAKVINTTKEMINTKNDVAIEEKDDKRIESLSFINHNNTEVKESVRIESTTIGILKDGQTVKVKLRENEWSYIELKVEDKSCSGWVLNKFIEEIKTNSNGVK